MFDVILWTGRNQLEQEEIILLRSVVHLQLHVLFNVVVLNPNIEVLRRRLLFTLILLLFIFIRWTHSSFDEAKVF